MELKMSTARNERGTSPMVRGAGPVLLVLTAVGVVTFIAGIALGMPWSLATWQALHINFIYLVGLAFAGTVISVIFELTSSGWGQNVKRLAEASVALIPLVLITYLGVVAGHHHVAHYLYDPEQFEHLCHSKQVWLEPTFLLTRDGLALLLLAALSLAFVYHSLRPRMGKALEERTLRDPTLLAAWIAKGFGGFAKEEPRSKRIRDVLAPIVIICYALVLSLIAFDQIMSLDSVWISTLFGGYYFITSLYLGWATLSATSVMARRHREKDAFSAYGKGIRTDDLHDLGKLTFAFCMLGADFFWSQFVVIWYGNLPEETPFIMRRVFMDPWSDVAWAVAFLCYAGPFVLLLFKWIKRTDITLLGVTVAVMVMIWIERFLLVAPSVWLEETVGAHYAYLLPVIGISLGVSMGFVGLAGLLYRWSLGTVLLAPVDGPKDDYSHGAPDESDGKGGRR
jgi:hypothetical protein